MLIENANVDKIPLMGLVHQTLAGERQGLKTLEVWLLTLPPGSESPVGQHYGEVVCITLQGVGRAVIDQDSFNLAPNTTLIIPPRVSRQVVNAGAEDLVVLIIRGLVRPPEKTMAEIMAGKP